MAAEYYSLEIKYQRDLFYIWMTDEVCDRFIAEQGRLLHFESRGQLSRYCAEQKISLIDERAVMEILPEVKLLALLKRRKTVEFCRVFLDMWNLAVDIQNSFEKRNPYLNGCQRLYDKIFWGSNLEVFSDENDSVYVPQFSRRERRLIRDVARRIYDLFEDRLEA